MQKPAFLQKETLTRLGVSFLLTAGIAVPLLLALDLSGNVIPSLLLALGLLLVYTALSRSRKTRILLGILLAGGAVVQLFLPHYGLLGQWVEAFKAFALYFSGYTMVLPLFGAQVASFITFCAASLAFLFSKRGAGFLPAAMLVLLVLFGLWNLGKVALLWYVAPALVALLLQMSQTAHDKINVLHVLPMAVAVVLLSFLLVPSARVTFAPLEKAASSLKQTITDYLFFTDPRNVFTLGTYGYYPMGNNQLGGEAEPSEFPVMMVKTTRKTLLRGVVKDYYDGRSFTDTSGAKRYLYVNPRWQNQRQKAFLELLPGEAILKVSSLLNEKAITVQMQNNAASTVFTPLFLRDLTMENDMVAYFNDASELFITRDLELGDRYTVFTPVFEGGDAGLDALVNAPQKKDSYYDSIYSEYTQLPDHMEQEVFDDVASIVAGETTPYGKAMAIMRHLQKYYRYTLSPDTPPANKDFVTYFLYVGKEGYCTYYASAMTVMCRMAGLPARYVEGFLAQPASDGFAYVTGKDAHAWTEVYFEGFGWVPFDATPLQQAGSDGNNQSNNQPSPSPSPTVSPSPSPTPTASLGDSETPSPPPEQDQNDEPTPEPQPSEEPDEQPDTVPPDVRPEDDQNAPPFWLWLLVLAVLGGFGARIALRSPGRVAARAKTPQEKLFIYGAAVQRLLIYDRHGPRPGETPLNFARRIDSVHCFAAPIMPLWRLLALSNYSRLAIGPEHVRRAQDIYQRGFRGTGLIRRIRFRLGAAFSRNFYRLLETPAPHDTPPVQKLPFTVPKPKGGKTAQYGRGAKPQAKGARNTAPAAPPEKTDAAPTREEDAVPGEPRPAAGKNEPRSTPPEADTRAQNAAMTSPRPTADAGERRTPPQPYPSRPAGGARTARPAPNGNAAKGTPRQPGANADAANRRTRRSGRTPDEPT